MRSFSRAVILFADEVGPFLVPEHTLERLHAATDQLDDVLCEFALESHINDASRHVDLVVRVNPENRDTLLSGTSRLSENVLNFMKAWARPSGSLSDIPFIELEYDLNGPCTDPWIGPAVEPHVAKGPLAIFRAKKAEREIGGTRDRFQIAKSVLGRLPIAPPSRTLVDRLRRCYEELPTTGSINHFTAAAARPSSRSKDTLRLIVALPKATLHTYLDAIGWLGDKRRVDEALHWFKPYADHVSFDLNIAADDAGDNIAFYTQFRCLRIQDDGLLSFIEALVRRNAVADSCRSALQDWIRKVSGRMGRGLTFKLSIKNDAPSVVKLYLSMYPPKRNQ